jgi:hypothetical protein
LKPNIYQSTVDKPVSEMKNNRKSFFICHLGISLIVAFLVVCLVFGVWYPYPLYKAVGVTHIFLMLIIIDVIIGPLLGFFVYKEGKKTLKMDLSIIILIQICALSFGVYSIVQGRPAWTVFSVDRFEVVKNNEIIEQEDANILPQFQRLPWLGPQYAALQFANDTETRNKDMFNEVFSGISLAQYPERYVDISKVTDQMLKRSHKIDELNQFNPLSSVEKILADNPTAYAYLPMKASAVDMTVLIDEKGTVIKIVDLRPWN